MKTHIYISALLVAAVTLLSSCSLLVASPIHSHRPHPHYAYIDVDDFSYYGPFYTITCDLDKQNWIIEVDPLNATPGEISYREVWVFMWDGSDNFNFVFQFEQNDDDSFEGIE